MALIDTTNNITRLHDEWNNVIGMIIEFKIVTVFGLTNMFFRSYLTKRRQFNP